MVHLFIQNLFSKYFANWLILQDSANELWRDLFYWNSKGHFQGQVWLIFTYFSLLISSIEMLAKYFSM